MVTRSKLKTLVWSVLDLQEATIQDYDNAERVIDAVLDGKEPDSAWKGVAEALTVLVTSNEPAYIAPSYDGAGLSLHS